MENILVNVTRGPIFESFHRGHIAVVDTSGKLIYSFGNPGIVTYIRSAAKPVQVLPLIESGASNHFGFSDEEIALMTSSHSGEPYHIDTVRSILRKINLSESALQCGSHAPFHKPSARLLTEKGEKPHVLHNNCSAKHTAMLAMCLYRGWSIENYTEISHPVQQENLKVISELSQTPPGSIHIGIDGCGAPVFGMPLSAMALIYAHLTNSQQLPEKRHHSCSLITQAMLKHPEMVAGTGRIDTEIMHHTSGEVLAKSGAEGIYCMGLLNKGLGIAFKVEDGSKRPVSPIVLEILHQLGIISENDLAVLSKLHHPINTNHRNDAVGEIKPVFKLKKY